MIRKRSRMMGMGIVVTVDITLGKEVEIVTMMLSWERGREGGGIVEVLMQEAGGSTVETETVAGFTGQTVTEEIEMGIMLTGQ